jgi:hypothetical protein
LIAGFSKADSSISKNLRNFSRSPLLINSSPEDEAFPIYKQQIADHELGNGAYIPGYQRMSWENCPHGWTVRGDLVSTTDLLICL